MQSLEILTGRIVRLLYWIAGAAIVGMMLLTVFDVVMRLLVTLCHQYDLEFLSVFRPVAGTYELVGFLGAVAVSFAMAHTSIQKGHVSVSLIVRLLPPRIQALIGGLTDILALFLFAVIAWRACLYAEHLRESGEVSLTLQLPFYPFLWGIAAAALAVCLVLFLDLMRDVGKVIYP